MVLKIYKQEILQNGPECIIQVLFTLIGKFCQNTAFDFQQRSRHLNNFMIFRRTNLINIYGLKELCQNLLIFFRKIPFIISFCFRLSSQTSDFYLTQYYFEKQILMQFNNDRYKSFSKSSLTTQLSSETNLLESVVQELDQKHDYEKILLEANKKFQIKQYNILNLSPAKALEIHKSLKNKFYSELNNQILVDQWCDNELRLFVWLFVCYLHVYKRSLDDLTKKDWIQFSEVFNYKTPFLFQYQARIIKKVNKKSKKWCTEEDQCLSKIIKSESTLLRSINSYRWSEIAKKLFVESNKKYFRTPKQCRQRWINHLDPEKVKSKWTLAEDCSLIGYVLKQGKKWAMVAKLMNNTRTQHMVKNRYNSLLKSQLKKFEEMADEVRVIKKLHYRLRYALESKNCEKENKEHECKRELKIEEQDEVVQFSQQISSLNQKQIEDFNQISTLDDVMELVKCGEPLKTSINLVDFDAINIQVHEIKQQEPYFLFEPHFPDFF